MLGRGLSSTLFVSVFLLSVLVFIGLAALAGYWLGKAPEPSGEQEAALAENAGAEGAPLKYVEETPIYCCINTAPGADIAAAALEIKMAAENGVHQYVLSVAPSWPGQEETAGFLSTPVETVLQADPAAHILLQVELDPPAAWLSQHPAAAVSVDGALQTSPCVASPEWFDGAKEVLEQLISQVKAHEYPITGYIPECLRNGRWLREGGYDTSEANLSAFRAWLKTRYGSEDALRAAWGNERASFGEVQLPKQLDSADTGNVFYRTPEEQSNIDFLTFNSDNTVSVLIALAAHIRQCAGPDTRVLLPYGDSYESLSNFTTHLALGRVLDGPVDGFASPVSYHDRGVGGVGGFMGPVDSARMHGKRWYLVDDTRTGISRDAASGEAAHLAGLRIEDVYNVQKRNFAAALGHGLGLFFCDPEGKGALLDAPMWKQFGGMFTAYADFWREINASGQNTAGQAPVELNPASRVSVCVVIDEASRFIQRCDEALNGRLLLEGRDSALMSGAPAEFCLLQDVLDGRAAPASVYLFLNLFRLDEGSRQRLHELLAKGNATAIWMYAPGYFAQTASVDNIAATTLLNVKAFDAPEPCGSSYSLDAKLIRSGEAFGEEMKLAPLFYIDSETDPNLAVLAQYRSSKKTSAAIKFLEQGWASVYVAEPAMTPELLRQILLIIEEHSYVKGAVGQAQDVSYFGPNLIAIHAKGAGDWERVIEFKGFNDVKDVLDEGIGWPHKQGVSFSMRFGETRILKLTPSPVDVEEAGTAPGEAGTETASGEAAPETAPIVETPPSPEQPVAPETPAEPAPAEPDAGAEPEPSSGLTPINPP